MKKLQCSTAAKVCAWIVLLAAAFGAGVFGVRAVLSFGSVVDDNWQSSSRYYNAVNERRRDLVEGIELSQTLEELEKQIAEGTTNPLAYADAEALREERTRVEERFPGKIPGSASGYSRTTGRPCWVPTSRTTRQSAGR